MGLPLFSIHTTLVYLYAAILLYKCVYITQIKQLYNSRDLRENINENEGYIYIPSGLKAILRELSGAGQNHDSNLSFTFYRKLMSVLQQSSSSFRKCQLPTCFVLNLHNLNLPTSHILGTKP